MISSKLPESPSSTTSFSMTITGELSSEDGNVFLKAASAPPLRVLWQLNIEELLAQGRQQWFVVPSINSTGAISGVHITGVADNSSGDCCELTGRVIQLSKRNNSVLLKVDRPEQKTLRLTLINPPSQMQVGQLWYVLAKLKENSLVIEKGDRVDDGSVVDVANAENNAGNGVISTIQDTTRDTTKERLGYIALQSLENTTGLTGWVINSPQKRHSRLWEWEAFNREVQRNGQPLRARVQVNPETSLANVYQYHAGTGPNARSPEIDLEVDNETTLDTDTDNVTPIKDRLIVMPLGAAKSIGASCFRVLIGPYEVVLDAGTRPKGDNPLPAFEYLDNPNLILISHAHQDHIGALPVFHRDFPTAPMICTPGTREIADIMLTDCLKIQQANEDFGELFDETDLNKTIFHLETQPVGVDFEPLPGLKVRFIHAGHIVGAACIYLRYGERSLFYTGDYNTTSSRTTDGLRLADLPEADILITESTYGADTHPGRNKQETELLNAVVEVVQQGGNVLIPAFALGRAQEIILAIRTSALFHKLKIPVYVDGLVRAVTDCFNENLDFLPASVQNFAKQQEPFFDPNGKPPIISIAHPRERPLALAQPSVIIASSGMLSGGASVFYGKTLLERENAAIFISGYTDEESPGRFLQGLKKGEEIELDGKKLTVRAQVRRFNLSAHADKIGLTQVINRVNPKHLVLIHGSLNALHELAKTGDLGDKYIIHVPDVGEAIEYGRAPGHISQNRLARIQSPQEFEVSIEAEIEGAWLRIPEDVLTDPRWEKLSSSGLLNAKWVNSALMLYPINNRHLAIEKAVDSGEDCCAVCESFSKGKCNCPDSPLFTLTVDPSAKCLEFQRHKSYTTFPTNYLSIELEPEDLEDVVEVASVTNTELDNQSACTSVEVEPLEVEPVEVEVDNLPEEYYGQPLPPLSPAEEVRILQAQLAENPIQVNQRQQLLEQNQQFLESTIGYDVLDAGVPPQQASHSTPSLHSSNGGGGVTKNSDSLAAHSADFLLTLKPAVRKEASLLLNQFIAEVESLGQLDSDTFRDSQDATITAARNAFILTLKPRDRKSATRLINKFVAYLNEQI